MSFVLLVENDMNIYVEQLSLEEDGSAGCHFTPLTLSGGVQSGLDAIESFRDSFSYHTEGTAELCPERIRGCRIETGLVVTDLKAALKTSCG